MQEEVFISYIEKFASMVEANPMLLVLLIIIFMTIESSFIPFPSEVVMIPAGFLVYKIELISGCGHWGSLIAAIVSGVIGSMIGAYINYWLAAWLGRPFLHKYGKYFFLKEQALDRAEEIFRKYGDVVTFVCRLLPAIRQLISIPAGLSKMNFWRFSLFTALGAGFWTAVLAGIGFWFGHISKDMSYAEMVKKGKILIQEHYIWIIVVLCAFVALYYIVEHLVMGKNQKKNE